MKLLLGILVFSCLAFSSPYSKGEGEDSSKKSEEIIIIKCDSTVKACILAITAEAKILFPQGDVISQLGLSPADLISVDIESDVKKKMPELWKAIPLLYRGKLKGAITIKHKGKIVID